MHSEWQVGVDGGGTFTDLFATDAAWRKDTLAGTPQSVLQWPASLKTRSVLLDFAEKTTWKRGISPVMVLWLDYSKWFDGVDLTEPDAVILAKMMDNLPGSFVLKKP